MTNTTFTPCERTQTRTGHGYAVEEWADSVGIRFEAPTLNEAVELLFQYDRRRSVPSMDDPIPLVVGE